MKYAIESSKIEEYKKLVQDMAKVVEADELNAINYEYYLNNAETSVIIVAYKNSEAA
jgi:hypothetical protein